MNGNKTPTTTIVETMIALPKQRKAFAEFCAESAFPIPNAPVRRALSCTEQQRADAGHRWMPLPKPKPVTLDAEDLSAILDTLHALGEFVGASSHRTDAQIAAGIAHHTVVSLRDKHDLPEVL
jgi:hypothetical protein